MRYYFTAAIVALFAFTSCKKETVTEYIEVEVEATREGETSLVFDAKYDGAEFELNKVFDYKLVNTTGEYDLQYKFTKLRYWVSNIVFIKANGEEFKVPDAYYLVEETNEQIIQDGDHNNNYPANKREEVLVKGVPPGEYKAVKFGIGIDSKYNDNLSLRAGELSVLNGMAKESWMWFTSYIFSSVSGEMTWVKDEPESKNFWWETGSNDLYKEKTIEFGKNITISSKTNSKISLDVDVKDIIDLEYPWSDNVIGATKPDLMEKLADNFLNKALSFKVAESTNK